LRFSPKVVVAFAFLLLFASPATAANCNSSVGSSLTLTGNVEAAGNTTCFTVTDNNVVFDCAGYRIRGNGPASETVVAVNVNGYRNFKLRNCRITLFNLAVNVSGSGADNGVYYNNTIWSNNRGFMFIGGDSCNVSYNNASLNTNANLYVYSFYAAMDANNFTHNQFDYSPGGYGIQLSVAAGNTLTNFLLYDNNASYNAVGGVYLTGNYHNFSYNNASYNPVGGFFADDNSGTSPFTYSNVSRNEFTGNAGFGIALTADANAIYNNTFAFNQIVSGTGSGVYLSGADANNFSYNTLFNNVGGFNLDSAADNNYFQNNTITDDIGWLSDALSRNNFAYHNLFYGGATAFVSNGNATNAFNVSVGGTQHGNYYENILNYKIYDYLGGDRWADYGLDLPYNASLTNKWLGAGGDWAPQNPRAGCGNLSANTTLNASVDASALLTNCFNVTANNLVLDCNGYAIRGLGSGYGIYNNGFRKLNVTNCAITNFVTGIYFAGDGADDGLAYNNTVHSNTGAGVYLEDGDSNNFSYNNVSYNTKYGFSVAGSATLNLFGFNRVAGNSVGSSSYSGFFVNGEGADQNVFYNNTAYANGDHGFSVSDADECNFSYNNASYGYSGDGFKLSGTATLSNLTFNIVNDNAAIGIRFYGDNADSNTAYANQVHGNGYGIVANSADYNNLSYNNIYNSSYSSIFGGVVLEGSASGNTVQNNTFNESTGLYLGAQAGENRIYHNTFLGGATSFVSCLNETNQFNTTAGGKAQGNYYADILTLRLYDSDNDGYGDMGSQYPYNSTFTANFTGSGADYGPISAAYHGCKSIAADFTLEANVFAGGFTNCFNITTNQITLDCAGYALSGVGSGIAFNNTGYRRVTIKNCAITNFTTAVLYLGDAADEGLVYNNTIWNNTADGIRFTDADGNNASYNNASHNLQGIALSGSAENQTLAWNTLAYNSIGANYSSASGSNSSNNNLSYNVVAGVRFEGAALNNTLTNDAITNAPGTAVQSVAGGYNVFLNSTFNKSNATISGGNITVKWYAALYLKDDLSNTVMGYLNISNSTYLMSSTAAAAGGYVTGIADEYFQNSTVTVNYTDQTLTVYGPGLLTGQHYYPSNATNYTIDQAVWPERMVLALCGNSYCYPGVEDASNCALDCSGGGGGGSSHPDPSPKPTEAPTVVPDPGHGGAYNVTPTPSPTAEPCETITETVTQGNAQCVEGVEQVLEVTRRIVVTEENGEWTTIVTLEITNLGDEGVENARIQEDLPAGLTSDQVFFVVTPDEDYGSSVAWVIAWLAPNAKAYLEYRADRLIDPNAFKEPGVAFQGTRAASVSEWLSTWGALNWLLASALALELAYAGWKLAGKKKKKKEKVQQ